MNRYDIWGYDWGEDIEPDGEWVKFEDVRPLAAKLTRYEKALREIVREVDSAHEWSEISPGFVEDSLKQAKEALGEGE